MKRLLLIAFITLSINAIAQTNTFPTNGNVGIGTIQPSDKLQIGDFNNVNNSKICIPGVYNFEQVRLGQYGNGACGLEFINHASLLASYGIRLLTDIDHFYGLQIQMATPANSYNELNYKTQFAITTNGNVGIGTTNPEAPLEIKSQIPHRGLIIGRENLNTKIYLHVAEGNYGYLDLGGNTQLRGNGQVSYFDGSLGIGTTNPAYKLDVLGTIRAKEVLVNLDGGADFVFEKGYKLLPIEHVASYVQENKHLPDIPSANEMTKNGVSMGDMQIKLLQKVEELTLYVIELKKEIETMKKKSINQ